jgi:hypothetical protein
VNMQPDRDEEHLRVLPSGGDGEADEARNVQAEVEAEAALDDFERRAAADLAAILGTDLLEVTQEPAVEGDAATTALEPSGDMVPREAAAASTVSPVAPSAPGPDVEVECPGCGLLVVGNDPRASAEWFCPRCDYPLFFVKRAAPPEPDGARRGARRRLPGSQGRVSSAAGPCWNCGEHQEAGVRECLRCAATLPKPAPPKLGPFEIVEAPEPELVEVEVLYWPPVVISVIGGFIAGMAFLGGMTMWLAR